MRTRFEEELQMQAFFYQEDSNAAQQAIKPASIITIGTIPAAKKSATIFSLPFKSFMAIAASVLVIVAGSVIYMLSLNSGKPTTGNPNVANLPVAHPVDTSKNVVPPKPAPNPVAANNTHTKDSLANKNIAATKHKPTPAVPAPGDDTFGRNRPKNDSAAATAAITDTGKASTAFAKFYTVYQSNGDDPAAANAAYQNYALAKYRLVIDAKDIPAQAGLPADSAIKVNGYLSLYKGLSYLAFNRPQSAISQFDGILLAFTKTQQLYYKAEWYKVLSLLKINYTVKAAQLAQSISKSLSPYKTQAAALVAAL